jgi:hypothetical protein
MDERDQELLGKQLWGVSERPQPVGVIVGFIMIFLVGLAIGDVLSKIREANPVVTNIDFAALNSSPNGSGAPK